MKHSSPQTIYLADYRPPAWLIDTVDLRFDLDEERTRVRSLLALRRNPAAGRGASLRLDGCGLPLIAIEMDGRALIADEDYALDAEGLTIFDAPDCCVLETETQLQPQHNTALEGLYKSSGNFCTQCEAEGFRKITWYLDRPDVMARFTVTIEAEQARYPVLLCNGNQIERGELENGRHFVTWEDPHPKPSYLFALVAGDLSCIEDSYTTGSGREVALRIYVEAHNADKCEHAMRSLKKAMRWDEETFGLEYDLDVYMIVAVDDFNMGAMENKGLNIFNSKLLLARPDTATDDDFLRIESVIAHEYFHNWTGNRVTCRDWFQLSLKEGLTVFRDQQFSAEMNSAAVQRIGDVRLLRAHQFPEDSGPMAHPVRPDSYIEINNFYTATVYEKGAEVIRMMHSLLGAEYFRAGMDLYFRRHDGQAVTCDDFVQAMQDADGIDFSQFKRWYSQAGTPLLQARGEYDADARQYHLQLRQHTPPTPGQADKLPLHIPLRIALFDAHSGRPQPLDLAGEGHSHECERVLDVTAAEQRFTFHGIDAPVVPSLLRGFSAPVQLDCDYSDAELAFLLARDDDPFNRWEAGQTLASRLMLQLADDYRAGRELVVPQTFVDAVRALLDDRDGDPALRAEALQLPREEVVGERMQTIDIDALHAARSTLRRQLAEQLQSALRAVYAANSDAGGEFSLDPAAMGRRKLKNVCLGYLCLLGDDDSLAAADRQFAAAGNMSDELAALAALVETGGSRRDAALDAFYAKWQGERLVIDKWFSLQAQSQAADTLARVRGLLRHADFEIRNPNRVRSLIGAFAVGNPVRFHAADGGGYQLLADLVIELDGLNPQVSARMVQPLSRWARYDEARQALMKAQLRRILEKEGVSRDVYEVVSKSIKF